MAKPDVTRHVQEAKNKNEVFIQGWRVSVVRYTRATLLSLKLYAKQSSLCQANQVDGTAG